MATVFKILKFLYIVFLSLEALAKDKSVEMTTYGCFTEIDWNKTIVQKKPTFLPMTLSCSFGQKIKIIEANYIRPGKHDKYKYEEYNCFTNLGGYIYNETVCCDIWADQPWNLSSTLCEVSLKQHYSGTYDDIEKNCSGVSSCELLIPFKDLTSECRNACYQDRCHSRRSEIKYVCDEDDNSTTVTPAKSRDKEHTKEQISCGKYLGISLGIAIPISLFIGGVVVYVLIRLRWRPDVAFSHETQPEAQPSAIPLLSVETEH